MVFVFDDGESTKVVNNVSSSSDVANVLNANIDVLATEKKEGVW